MAMRLCIVTHSFAKGSGQGRVNYEVVKEALRQKHHITLIGSEIATEFEEHDLISWVPIRVEKWPTELLKNIAFSIQASSWIQQHRAEFDLINVNGAITAAKSDVNAVHFVHSAWLQSPVHTSRVRRDLYGLYQWCYTSINSFWEKQAFRNAKTVVAVSERVAKELVALGVSSERIRVIINGVDTEEFAPGSVSRNTLGLPDNVPLALFTGDIRTSRKNLDTVLLALLKVPDLHIAIAGRTDDSPYPQMAKQLGISQRTHFLDYRRDIPALMKAADFFVFPSRYEPWGLALVEAMASGLPVITAITAGGAELVTSESGIVLDDPNDIESLTDAMRKLSGSNEHRQKMGEAARVIAERQSWEAMAQQYLGLFKAMMQMQ